MQRKEEKKSVIEFCPIRNVVSRFGNKWALLVILILDENKAIRFGQIGKQIPDISPKVLSDTLRTLEADGLVNRTVYPEVPIRVEYELTEIGRSLVPIIQTLTEWALKNMKQIVEHRAAYDDA